MEQFFEDIKLVAQKESTFLAAKDFVEFAAACIINHGLAVVFNSDQSGIYREIHSSRTLERL